MSKISSGNFFDEWSIYDEILARNYMHHDDIFRDVRRLLADRFGATPFTILDLGCGSARHLARALKGRTVRRYVGYDISTAALSHAARNLAALNCPADLRYGDLLDGVKGVGEKFVSYLQVSRCIIFLRSRKMIFLRHPAGRSRTMARLCSSIRCPTMTRTARVI